MVSPLAIEGQTKRCAEFFCLARLKAMVAKPKARNLANDTFLAQTLSIYWSLQFQLFLLDYPARALRKNRAAN
jgi:hypothetical protein